jgi:hypothetical protein
VTDEQPPARPVSHRAPVSRGESLRRLWPPFAAVAAVVVVIVLLLALNGRSTPAGGPALQSPSPVVSEQAPATPPPSSTPTPTPTITPTHHTSPARSRGQHTATAVPVDVLNNSTISGLAHEVAQQVEAKGGPVDVIGNFRGRIAESTLYYDSGQRDVATILARAMPQIRRVLPRFAGLPGDGLTLVVTRDWPH